MIAMQRAHPRIAVLSGLAVLLLLPQACSDPSQPSVAASIGASSGIPTTAGAGSSLTPSVVVSDEGGRPLRGVGVSFQVTGGGSITNTTATTNSSGIASPGQWTLSTTAGVNTLRATAGSISQTFAVEAIAGQPAAVVAVEGNPTTGTVNTILPTAPAVRVTDQHGNPVANVLVTFTPEAGSGSVSGGTQATGPDGIAQPVSWTLGPTAGEQKLTARAVEITATITVTAVAPPFAKFAGDQTTCPVNTQHCFFTVIAASENGTPMVGQPITWTTPEGATLVTTTNAKGRTTAPNLTVRATPGSAMQRARLDSTGDEVTFNFQVVQGGGYNLDIRFVGDVPASQQAIFASAAARWEQVITGNLTPIDVPAGVITAGACFGIAHPAFSGVIDDLLIYIVVDSIDGVGNKLGRAGPCFVRSSNTLPVFGVMELDSADVSALEANGMLYDVILHELGHVIGFATIWDDLGLITGAGGSDPFFTGARGKSSFQLVGGTLLNGVPVENTGGEGTRDGHWRETTFSRELMTGYINNPPNPLSALTIASFMDLGYQVNFGAADNFVVSGGTAGLRQGAPFITEIPHTEPLPGRLRRLPDRQ
jgi:hypothetical protein